MIKALFPFILHHPLLNEVSFRCFASNVDRFAAWFRGFIEHVRGQRKGMIFRLLLDFHGLVVYGGLDSEIVKNLHSCFDVIDSADDETHIFQYGSIFKSIRSLDVELSTSRYAQLSTNVVDLLPAVGARRLTFRLETGNACEWARLDTIAKILPQVNGLCEVDIASPLVSPGWRSQTMHRVTQQLTKLSSAGEPLKLVLEFIDRTGPIPLSDFSVDLTEPGELAAELEPKPEPKPELELELIIDPKVWSGGDSAESLLSCLYPILNRFILVRLSFHVTCVHLGWAVATYDHIVTTFGSSLRESEIRFPVNESSSYVPRISAVASQLLPTLESLSVPFRLWPAHRSRGIKTLCLHFDSESENWESLLSEDVEDVNGVVASIEYLQLTFQKPVPEGILLQLLRHVLSWRGLRRLRLRVLSDQIDDPEILELLLKSEQLYSLDVLMQFTYPTYFVQLFELLAANTTLTYFEQHMSYAITTAAEGEALRKFLQRNSTLQCLVYWISIESEYNSNPNLNPAALTESIISQFEHNTTLQQFTMEYLNSADEVRHANITMRNLRQGIQLEREYALIVAKHMMGESRMYDKNLSKLVSAFVAAPFTKK